MSSAFEVIFAPDPYANGVLHRWFRPLESKLPDNYLASRTFPRRLISSALRQWRQLEEGMQVWRKLRGQMRVHDQPVDFQPVRCGIHFSWSPPSIARQLIENNH
jgi:hypothetical protein